MQQNINSTANLGPETTAIIKNAGINIVGQLFFVAAQFMVSIIITRAMGPELYGIYVLAITIISLLGIVALCGMENTMVKFVAQFKGQNDTPRLKGTIFWGIGLVSVVSVLLGIVLYCTSGLLANKVFHEIRLQFVLRIVAIALPFSSITLVLVAALQGAKFITYKVLIQRIFVPAIRVVCVALAIYLGYRLIGLSWVYVFMAVIGSLLAGYYMLKSFRGVLKNQPLLVEKKQLLRFSTPLLFSSVFNRIISSADMILMGYFLPSAMVGIYGAANRIKPIISMPLNAVNITFAPMISDLSAKNKREKLEHQFKTTNRHVLTVSLPLFALLAIFSRQIMGVFGTKFVYGAEAMMLLCAGQLINAVSGSVGYMLMMTGRAMANLINSGFLCTVNILLNLYLIPKYGILGAAWANVIAISAIQLLRLAEVWYFLKMHPYSWNSLKPILSSVLSAALVLLLFYMGLDKNNFFVVFAMITIYLTAYLTLLWAFRLSQEDRMVLEKLKAKLCKS